MTVLFDLLITLECFGKSSFIRNLAQILKVSPNWRICTRHFQMPWKSCLWWFYFSTESKTQAKVYFFLSSRWTVLCFLLYFKHCSFPPDGLTDQQEELGRNLAFGGRGGSKIRHFFLRSSSRGMEGVDAVSWSFPHGLIFLLLNKHQETEHLPGKAVSGLWTGEHQQTCWSSLVP